jgi:hypothetical protein
MMIDFLDRDHEALAESPIRLPQVQHLLLRWALSGATRYRIEFDHDRLQALIGEPATRRLFPGFSERHRHPPAYDVYEGRLDDDLARQLLELLAPQAPSTQESPFNYIRSLRLLDGSGRTRLRIGDHNDVHLLRWRVEDRQAMIAAFAELNVPGDVLRGADVDIEDLQP